MEATRPPVDSMSRINSSRTSTSSSTLGALRLLAMGFREIELGTGTHDTFEQLASAAVDLTQVQALRRLEMRGQVAAIVQAQHAAGIVDGFQALGEKSLGAA